MHRCIAILGPAIRVSYRDPSIAILKKKKKKKNKIKKYQSHMAFSSVLPFLLPTHSVNCAVHLLLCHSRALLVNSALFLFEILGRTLDTYRDITNGALSYVTTCIAIQGLM